MVIINSAYYSSRKKIVLLRSEAQKPPETVSEVVNLKISWWSMPPGPPPPSIVWTCIRRITDQRPPLLYDVLAIPHLSQMLCVGYVLYRALVYTLQCVYTSVILRFAK